MNIFKKIAILSTAILSIGFSLPALVPQHVNAETAQEAACKGVELTGGEACGEESEGQVSGVLQAVIDLLSLIVGVAAVIMIIIGGLRYITSGGDSNSTKGAKDTIIYAVVGLVVVALAQVIVRFVLTNV